MNPATPVVADTQVLIWYVFDPDRLTEAAVGALNAATDADQAICLSAYSLVELIYAVEKATNPFTEEDRQAILGVLSWNDTPFEVFPVTTAIANRVAHVPRHATADPGDRIIAATAEVLGVPVVSADQHMPSTCRSSVIW